MKKILVALTVVALFSACGSGAKKEEPKVDSTAVVAVDTTKVDTVVVADTTKKVEAPVKK